MYYLPKRVLFGSVFVIGVLTSEIQIYQYPYAGIRPGDTTTLQWSGGDGQSGVTIVLVQGYPTHYVSVQTIISDYSQGTSYDWIPNGVSNAGDYALEIMQGSGSDMTFSYTPDFLISTDLPTTPVVPPISIPPIPPVPTPPSPPHESSESSLAPVPVTVTVTEVGSSSTHATEIPTSSSSLASTLASSISSSAASSTTSLSSPFPTTAISSGARGAGALLVLKLLLVGIVLWFS